MILGISYPIPENLQLLCDKCHSLEFLLEKYSEIQHVCAFNNVKELYLIGSAARAQFEEGHDLDFLVDFVTDDTVDRCRYYLSLKSYLTDILHQTIDLHDKKFLSVDKIKVKDKISVLLYKK